MFSFRCRPLLVACAIAATLALFVSDAQARAGRGGSFGSRGSQTFSAPPSTATSPTARPVERSMTQPGQPGSSAQRAPSTSPLGGFFNRPGFLGGMFAGFLGAGLFGMLFGHGLLGGLGGFASFLGLILQIGLVLIIGRFLWNMWQRRQSAPAYAGGPTGSPMLREVGSSGFGGSGFGAAPGGGGTPSAPIEITPADYDAFERLLGDIQAVYSNEDLNGLRQHLTPEMVSYFSEQLSENVSRGVVNKVSNVKLLQGDLAEAWRENGVDYASVAMRYALVDRFLDRTSGRLVDGSETPEEVTEVWTFMRGAGGQC